MNGCGPPRRSPKLDHLCSDRVAHPRNRVRADKPLMGKALSSPAPPGRWVTLREHIRVISRECRRGHWENVFRSCCSHICRWDTTREQRRIPANFIGGATARKMRSEVCRATQMTFYQFEPKGPRRRPCQTYKMSIRRSLGRIL